MKHLSILGSTGSIGTNVLNIVEMFPQKFKVKALAAGKNVSLLASQIERFKPEVVAVFDDARARELETSLSSATTVDILFGDDGYCETAAHAGVDVTLTVWPKMWHVWHILAPYLPEAIQATHEIGSFVHSHIASKTLVTK